MRHVAWVHDNSAGKTIQAFISGPEKVKTGNVAREQDRILGNEQIGFTTYRFVSVSWDDAQLMIKRGQASLILFEKGDSVQYFFDPKNPEAQLAFLQISSAMKNPEMREAETIRTFSESGMRYIDFLIPGILAMDIMFGGLWGVSYSLIEKRSKKLMRRMVATPMSKSAFLFSHLIARFILSFVESLLLWLFGWWYFDTTIQGSIPALLVLLIAGNIVFFGIAVLMSSRTANTQIGNGLINAVSMPMMICSGVFFSYHNFPDWMIAIIRFLPLTIIADNIRSVFIEGAGFSQVMPSLWILTGLGLVLFLIGKKMYKWY